MTAPLIRYRLDPTGKNSDNLVADEVHTLNDRDIRAVVPLYSPFYAESIIIKDFISGIPLVKEVDYQCIEILQEATLKYGKEITQVVIILNKNISNKVKITYQVLGGLYTFDMSAVVNMYETAQLDKRPVDWLGITNKPFEYPPSLHNHVLADVYGFEYLVVAIERIRNAIVLSNVPAFEAIIDLINSKTPDVVTIDDIKNGVPIDGNKLITADVLSYVLDNYTPPTGYILTADNYRTINNTIVTFTLEVKNPNPLVTLYWSIDHRTTQDSDFTAVNGKVVLVAGKAEIKINVLNAVAKDSNESFTLVVRSASISGDIKVSSDIVTIWDVLPPLDPLVNYIEECCVYNPMVNINASSLFLLGRKYA